MARRAFSARRRGRLLAGLVVGALLLVAAPVAYAVGHWHASGRLHEGRYLATMNLLPSGEVLVTGGFGSKVLATAELYDPGAGSWSYGPSFYSPRFAHSATTLGDGSILVAGGGNLTAGYLASAERYLPSVNRWVYAGQMAGARDNHTATLLGDGRVLVAGGYNGLGPAVRTAELYDPVANTWSRAASMRIARYHQTATLLKDGRVLVVGGEQQDNQGGIKLFSSAEIYDPVHNRWKSAASLPYGLANHTATLLHDGRVLVVGGGDRQPGFTASAEIYDPKRNHWSRASSLPAPRAFQVAVLLRDGRVLVAGGINDRGALGAAELFDPHRDRWSSAGRLPQGFSQAATLLDDGRVLVAGGRTYQGVPLASSWIYTP